jgi:hypothetical protein
MSRSAGHSCQPTILGLARLTGPFGLVSSRSERGIGPPTVLWEAPVWPFTGPMDGPSTPGFVSGRPEAEAQK